MRLNIKNSYYIIKIIYFVIKTLKRLVILITTLFLLTQCAQIAPLTGGKKDTEAPKVLKCEPENASLNFNTSKITIQFDEFIVLKDLTNQLIVTPQTKELPEVDAQGKKLVVQFNETLLPNTTYKIAFGNSIVDMRENNVLNNFEYIFSTGNSIDSLTLKGTVSNYKNQNKENDIVVGLYNANSNDSVIFNTKPLYITKTNANGEFAFNYLPQSNYKIVAVKDHNKNLMYDGSGSDEQIAFLNKSINTSDTTNNHLVLFKEVPTKNYLKRTIQKEYGIAELIFNKAQHIKSLSSSGLISYLQNKTKDTLSLYYQNVYDTLHLSVNYTDGNKEDYKVKIPSRTEFEKLNTAKNLKYKLTTTINGNLPYYQNITLPFNYPINQKQINSAQVLLYELNDTTKVKKEFKLITDNEYSTQLIIQTKLKEETSYKLIIPKGCINNENGRFNDSIIYSFKTTSQEDYAQLIANILFPNKENYIVQLLNDKNQVVKEEVVSFSVTSTSEKQFNFSFLVSGTYHLQIIEDANKNGLFDTGDYLKHIQPEKLFIHNQPIKLLLGWEIETKWHVN